jgi:hypothetical protein
MQIPIIRGVIDRRILVNYRVDPAVLESHLPPPFRPKLVSGFGMVGICLIRLKRVRPAVLPRWIGLTSENAAHRAAVEWDENGLIREAVYVRRRDTNSLLNTWAGGRLFPGIHHHAVFRSEESGAKLHVALRSDDGVTDVDVRCRCADDLPSSSAFRSMNDASEFFQAGSLGYSATAAANRFQGMELRCSTWDMRPLRVQNVRSSYFDDESLFPKGSIEFDSAFLMRNIEHEWHGRPDLCCACVETGVC